MEPWQKEIISNNLDSLVECTNLTAFFYANLCSKGLLETSEMWELEAEKNTGVKNRRFYEIVREKPHENSFDVLISAFSDSRQTAVTHLLSNPTTGRNRTRDAADDMHNQQEIADPGMTTWQREHIRSNLVDLCENVVLTSVLLASLICKEILNQHDIWALEAMSNPGMKTLKFFDIIQTKGNNSFDELIAAFEQCGQMGACRILKAARNPAP